MFIFFKHIEDIAFRGFSHMMADVAKLKEEILEHANVKTVEGISLTNLSETYATLADEAHAEAQKAQTAALLLGALVVPAA